MRTKENFMPRYLHWVALALGLLFATHAARADSLTFTVTPTDVSGPAGTTVGWGFTITNTSTTMYLDISAIDSTLFLAADGTADASIFNFPNVAPVDTVTQSYDPADNLGLFQFTWNTGVAVGTTETGTFTLYGAFCPASDPTCVDDGTVPQGTLATADYTATVAGAASLPEPSSFLLLLAGIGGMALWGRHPRQR
jgi:hypothetical protein